MIGQRVSHYKIIDKLGEGGMGEVYLAEDIRLRRNVALKFLPKHATQDLESRKRFEREAQAAAALNHPNIVTIHDIGEHDGQVYLAMEYVEGRTLREIMDLRRDQGKGAFSIEDIVNIAGQLCAGLDKAHQADIVHRDIKPENILIGEDNQVKILDFGIAKLRGVTKLTKESSTLGTIHYMSPEQTRGVDVDHRADIWSLGVLLYEMLTGQLPFKGDYPEAVIYSILNESPQPIPSRRPDTPPALAGIIDRALRKDPADRYASLNIVAAQLAGLGSSTGRRSADKSPGSKWKKTVLYPILAVVSCAVVILAVTNLLKKEQPAHGPPVHEQVTFDGTIEESTLSPDGNYIAFRVIQDITSKIFVKDLRGGSRIELFSSSFNYLHKWSSDGSSLLFASMSFEDSSQGIYIIPRLGGQPRQVIPSPWGYTAWSPDGSQIAHIAAGQKTVDIISLQTNETFSFELKELNGEIASLDWSPHGDLLLFQADDPEFLQLWTVRTDGRNQQILLSQDFNSSTPIKGARWAPAGDAVYFLRFRPDALLQWDLMKIGVDIGRVRTIGEPKALLSSLQVKGDCDVSRDGKRLLYTQASDYSNHWLFTVEGEGPEYTLNQRQLTRSTIMKSRAAISPDGRRIVFQMSMEGQSNIYSLSLDEAANSPQPQQLTFLSSLNDMPVWSPDGKEIAFVSTQGGTPKIWRMKITGGTPTHLETSKISLSTGDYLTWAPGSDIIYRSLNLRNFSVLNPGNGQQYDLVEDDSNLFMFQAHWSPDGRRVAVFQNREGTPSPFGLWVIDAQNKSQTKIDDSAYMPLVWSDDGLYVYATKLDPVNIVNNNTIFKIPVAGGEPEPYVTLPYQTISDTRLSMTPDGRKIVYSKVEERADAWIVDNFDPDVE